LRVAEIERKTKETRIRVKVTLDGKGVSDVRTGVKFLDHMLSSLATHSLIDLEVEAEGDLRHHIVEDVALVLGQALNKSLGNRAGILRFGHAIIPMDDALVIGAIDLVKRPFSSIQLQIRRTMVEDAPKEDLEHFFPSLATTLEATIHLKAFEGSNDHHKFEGAVKAFALALRDAITLDSRRPKKLPSSKGMM
jgi:imidazoleglycerol-phosphate dehydratase